jgi:4a-hydroxytetrahydrobiopterin dehydratase
MHPFSDEEAAFRLRALPGWQIEAGELTRTFAFQNFPAALAFVNRLGERAEQVGHHPDIDIRYNRVRVSLITHDAGEGRGGLTTKDFELAAVADRLV